MIPKPKLEDFNKLTTEHGPVNPDLYRFTIAMQNYERARAERAIVALKDIARRRDEAMDFVNNPAKYGGVSTLAVDLAGNAQLALQDIEESK